MAKYKGPKARISRTFGAPVLGCEKVLKKKNYPPGQHGKSRKKRSSYAMQLLAKQKAKYIYGVLEKQFRNLVKKSSSKKGVAGEILMQLLEMRLHHVVYRMGICPTNAAARQFVVHKHVLVNGKIVNIPSYNVKKGDVIALTPKAREFTSVKSSLANHEHIYPWLAWDSNKMTGVVLEIPVRKLIPEPINEKAIIEFYAR